MSEMGQIKEISDTCDSFVVKIGKIEIWGIYGRLQRL
jgi:hypothetical protein